MNDWRQMASTFSLVCLAVLMSVAGRLGLSLAKDLPPDDPSARESWWRRRLWLVVADLSTVPALSAGVTAAGAYWHWPLLYAFMAGLAAGGVGLAFIINELKRRITAQGGGNA